MSYCGYLNGVLMTSILQEFFSSEVSTAFLWLLVANLAISPPYLSTVIGCAATGDVYNFLKILSRIRGLFEAVFTRNHTSLYFGSKPCDFPSSLLSRGYYFLHFLFR